MKKKLLIALLLFCISTVAMAQQNPQRESRATKKRIELVNKTAEEIARKRTDHVDKEVNLTEQQRKDVYALYLKEAKERIEAEQKASQMDKSTSTRRMKNTTQDEVSKLLSAEQREKWEQTRKERSKQRNVRDVK